MIICAWRGFVNRTMRKSRSRIELALTIGVSAMIVSGCQAPEAGLQILAGSEVMQDSPPDEVLRERVEQALTNSMDVPALNITVAVNDGTVTLTASELCAEHECPGRGTPGGVGTVQQSIGAVVRAIPGVRAVEFSLGIPREP